MGKCKGNVRVLWGGNGGEKLSFSNFKTGQISCLGIPGGGNEVVKCVGAGGWLCRFTDLL